MVDRRNRSERRTLERRHYRYVNVWGSENRNDERRGLVDRRPAKTFSLWQGRKLKVILSKIFDDVRIKVRIRQARCIGVEFSCSTRSEIKSIASMFKIAPKVQKNGLSLIVGVPEILVWAKAYLKSL